MKRCRKCHAIIDDKRDVCTGCRKRQNNNKVIFVTVFIFILIIFIAMFQQSEKNKDKNKVDKQNEIINVDEKSEYENCDILLTSIIKNNKNLNDKYITSGYNKDGNNIDIKYFADSDKNIIAFRFIFNEKQELKEITISYDEKNKSSLNDINYVIKSSVFGLNTSEQEEINNILLSEERVSNKKINNYEIGKIKSYFVMTVNDTSKFSDLNKEIINENLSEEKNSTSNLKKLDSNLKNNFIKACDEIKLDYTKIKKLNKIDDWYSGVRYTFSYLGTNFVLYAYEEGEISTIRIGSGNGISIYDEKYESLDVSDFLVDNDKLAEIQLAAEKEIKNYLNNPKTAKFKWITTGSYSRQNDIYSASGKLSAKNSYGVENDMSFYIEINVKDNRILYLSIDGKKYVGKEKNIGNLNRKEKVIKESNSNDSNKIVLQMNVMGQYGKKEKYDGEEYIRYFVPAGKYKVKALIKNATFFIEKKAIKKDSSGYQYSDEVEKIILSKKGDTKIIEIKNDEVIDLVINTKIELEMIK